MKGSRVYNYLQVKETEDRTILSTNVLFGVQSVKMKQEGLTGMYYDYALAAPGDGGTAPGDRGPGFGSGQRHRNLCPAVYPLFSPGPGLRGGGLMTRHPAGHALF